MSREPDSATESGVRRRIIQVAAMLAVLTLVLFAGAGTLNWLWAWIYLCVAATAVVMRDQRETIAERSRTKGMKDWDRAVSGLWGLCYFIAIPLVAGLNARLGWTSQLAIARHTAGIVLFAAGFALTVWSMVENIYFSTILRVQEERGHTVCTRGPYHFVRHPAYVGAILQSLAIPLVFGSVWTLTLGAAAATLMMVRTVLEDCTLRDELAGYEEYTTITPYRLVPGIW